MQEHWTQWKPISDRFLKWYYTESISDNENGLKIILFDAENPSDKRILIHFTKGVDAYRITNESFTNEIINFVDDKYGVDFYVDWPFFKIEDSEYLEWLNKKSSGISEPYKFTHYCIFTSDALLDILSYDEPIVTLIEDKK